MSQTSNNIAAQAVMHHSYLLGLQLMVATNKEPQKKPVYERWAFN